MLAMTYLSNAKMAIDEQDWIIGYMFRRKGSRAMTFSILVIDTEIKNMNRAIMNKKTKSANANHKLSLMFQGSIFLM